MIPKRIVKMEKEIQNAISDLFSGSGIDLYFKNKALLITSNNIRDAANFINACERLK